MKDRNIRDLLKKTELQSYIADYPHSKIIEEMKLPVAGARIDIAVVNGHFHGYEIKSASDTLQRLPSQIEAYSKVFDYITVVTERKYFQKVRDKVPNHVGVAICSNRVGEKEFEVIIPPAFNNTKKGFFIAKLLWKDELVELINELKIPIKVKNRSWLLCKALEEHLEVEALAELVREKLKKRSTWRVKEDFQVMKYDGSDLTVPK